MQGPMSKRVLFDKHVQTEHGNSRLVRAKGGRVSQSARLRLPSRLRCECVCRPAKESKSGTITNDQSRKAPCPKLGTRSKHLSFCYLFILIELLEQGWAGC